MGLSDGGDLEFWASEDHRPSFEDVGDGNVGGGGAHLLFRSWGVGVGFFMDTEASEGFGSEFSVDREFF